jgi:hypothetical protein
MNRQGRKERKENLKNLGALRVLRVLRGSIRFLAGKNLTDNTDFKKKKSANIGVICGQSEQRSSICRPLDLIMQWCLSSKYPIRAVFPGR